MGHEWISTSIGGVRDEASCVCRKCGTKRNTVLFEVNDKKIGKVYNLYFIPNQNPTTFTEPKCSMVLMAKALG